VLIVATVAINSHDLSCKTVVSLKVFKTIFVMANKKLFFMESTILLKKEQTI
jgi:hypothetical protein